MRFFAHPLTLTRLAQFLLMALSESRKTPLPIVLAALRPFSDTYIVVGVHRSLSDVDSADRRRKCARARAPRRRRAADVGRRSKFSIALRKAAESSRASFKHDGFEASVIEVQRGDLTQFLETLQANSATLLHPAL